MDTVEKKEELIQYGENYSENNFQKKILNVAKKAGIKVVYAALLLFYTLKDDRVPSKEKMIVIGALGYFILPTDLLMDFIPVAGYADDLVALLIAIKSVYDAITPDIQEKAKAKAREIFGEIEEDEFDILDKNTSQHK